MTVECTAMGRKGAPVCPGGARSTSTVMPFWSTVAEVALPGQFEFVERSTYRTRTIMSKAEFGYSGLQSQRSEVCASGIALVCRSASVRSWRVTIQRDSTGSTASVPTSLWWMPSAIPSSRSSSRPGTRSGIGPYSRRSSAQPSAEQASPIWRSSPITRMTISGRC